MEKLKMYYFSLAWDAYEFVEINYWNARGNEISCAEALNPVIQDVWLSRAICLTVEVAD